MNTEIQFDSFDASQRTDLLIKRIFQIQRQTNIKER
jgi:hypothetical protein